MKLKNKIIKLLLESKEEYSIRQIALKLKADYKNTYQAINSLNKEIFKDKKGNATYVSFSYLMTSEVYIVERKRTNLLLKNKSFKVINEEVKSLNNPFVIVLLFGSMVKGKISKHSDVDLCVVAEKKVSKELYKKLSLLSLPLEIHNFTSEEFQTMLKTKESNIAKEIVKNNVILFGIENYYNLIEKWMGKEQR